MFFLFLSIRTLELFLPRSLALRDAWPPPENWHSSFSCKTPCCHSFIGHSLFKPSWEEPDQASLLAAFFSPSHKMTIQDLLFRHDVKHNVILDTIIWRTLSNYYQPDLIYKFLPPNHSPFFWLISLSKMVLTTGLLKQTGF